MIKADGIMAFRGVLVYNPPNPKFADEIVGDFVHRQFDEGGYWYDGWRSYDDRFCEVREATSASELIGALEARLNALLEMTVTAENVEEVREMIRNTVDWLNDVKLIGGAK